MKKMCNRSLFVSFLALFSLSAIFQTPAWAMDDDTDYYQTGKSVPQKKTTIDLDQILTSLQCNKFSNFYDVFKALEKAANKATSNSKHAEAAQLYEAMARYAAAIEDPSSQYCQSYGTIFDFGAVMGAERDKQNAIRLRKKMGLKGAGESYGLAKNYCKSVEMWEQFLEYKLYKLSESLSSDEENNVFNARKLAKSSESLSIPPWAMDEDQIRKDVTHKKTIISLDEMLTSLDQKKASFYEIFKTLETSATIAASNYEYAEAAQFYEGMALYADGIEDSSSKYYKSFGPILDFGAVMGAARDKQKEVIRRKKMGLKGAGEFYGLAKNCSKSVEMWNKFSKYKLYKLSESLSSDENEKVFNARKLSKNSED